MSEEENSPLEELLELLPELGLTAARLCELDQPPELMSGLGNVTMMCHCGLTFEASDVEVGGGAKCPKCGTLWTFALTVCAEEVE